MKKEEFVERIKELLFVTKPNFGVTTVLNDLDGWDSLGRLSLAAMLHESFGKIVDTKTLRNIKTFGDIVELIEDKLKG